MVCGESVPVKGSAVPLPARGFVTCCNTDISQKVMFDSIVSYLKSGGRFIDTAPVYGYEGTVGKAVRASGIPREQIWISANIDTDGWRALMGYPKHWARAQVNKSLESMNLTYLDSMTLHAGVAQLALESPQPVGKNASKWHTMSPMDYAEMWRGLIEAKKHGHVRNLGTCLSSRLEIEHLIHETGVPPAHIMVWYNPWLQEKQTKFVSWAKSQEMAVIAYGLFNFKERDDYKEAAEKAAKRHNVTYGQLAVKWALDQGVAFMTGLYHPQYMREDLPCLDFQMDATDHKILKSVPEWPCNMQYLAKQFVSGCIP